MTIASIKAFYRHEAYLARFRGHHDLADRYLSVARRLDWIPSVALPSPEAVPCCVSVSPQVALAATPQAPEGSP
jgi:hypothetical protein